MGEMVSEDGCRKRMSTMSHEEEGLRGDCTDCTFEGEKMRVTDTTWDTGSITDTFDWK